MSILDAPAPSKAALSATFAPGGTAGNIGAAAVAAMLSPTPAPAFLQSSDGGVYLDSTVKLSTVALLPAPVGDGGFYIVKGN